jgi:hypothetical protein
MPKPFAIANAAHLSHVTDNTSIGQWVLTPLPIAHLAMGNGITK